MVQLFEDVPACFMPPDTLVGKSNNSIVIGYTPNKILLKCDRKSMVRVYPDLKTAYSYIGREQKERKQIRDELQKVCKSPNILPPVDVVIYNGEDGSICYSEVQEWFQNGKTLAQLGWQIVHAKMDTIHDIRSIFTTSIKHYLETGDLYDVQGTVIGSSGFQKVSSALIPLFSSTNVLVCNDQVHFIDATMLVGDKLPLRTVLHRQIKMVGVVLSTAILDTVVLGKKLKRLAANFSPHTI